MPLDPLVARYLLSEASAGPAPELSLAERRRLFEQEALADAGPAEVVEAVEDRTLAGPGGKLPIRLYTPQSAGPRPWSALLYFHSGGWMIGSIATHDPICRALANHTRCLVISVEYRLAPEHPFPAAPEDGYAALVWTAEHADQLGIDAACIAVGGESSGGNLAAAVALMARDRQGPGLAAQVIIYGETDHYDSGTVSYEDYAEGYGLTRASLIAFWDAYLPRFEDRSNPYAVPLRAPDLAGLPPALIITAEYDPGRDEAEHYAARLKEARVPVQISRYTGMIHGFFRQRALFEQSHQALAEVADFLQKRAGRDAIE